VAYLFGIFLKSIGKRAIVNKLAFAARLNQTSFGQRLKVMGNGCRRQLVPADDLAAIHLPLRRDRFENTQPARIRKGVRDFGHLFRIHKP